MLKCCEVYQLYMKLFIFWVTWSFPLTFVEKWREDYDNFISYTPEKREDDHEIVTVDLHVGTSEIGRQRESEGRLRIYMNYL